MLLPLSPAFCRMRLCHVISYGVIYLFLYLFLGHFPRNIYPFKRGNREGSGVGWCFLRCTFGSKNNGMLFHLKTNKQKTNLSSGGCNECYWSVCAAGHTTCARFLELHNFFFPEHCTYQNSCRHRCGRIVFAKIRKLC